MSSHLIMLTLLTLCVSAASYEYCQKVTANAYCFVVLYVSYESVAEDGRVCSSYKERKFLQIIAISFKFIIFLKEIM